MAIFLKVKTGPDAGKSIEIHDGLTIGRSPGSEILFDDPRMSGVHVKVRRSAQGFILEDLGSKNGFRVDGVRSTKTPLISGISLRIGSTEFEVSNSEDVQIEVAPPIPPGQISTNVPAADDDDIDMASAIITPPTPPPPKPVPLKWYEYFVQFIRSSSSKVKSKPRELRPFRRLVKLVVTSGIQNEIAWTVGYGPRQIGPQSCDLVIEDPGAPPLCFSISPEGTDGVLYSTDRPDIVRLNNKAVRSDTLKDGDVISFASTSIQFGYDKNESNQ